MVYLLTFLEGILAFLSPCVLALLPAYVSYFAAGEAGLKRTRKNAIGFFLGLVITFVALGALLGFLGARLPGRPIEVVGGAFLVLFGLHYMGLFHLPSLAKFRGKQLSSERLSTLTFPWAVVFGIVFALCWTPCVGPFLGAALMKAAIAGNVMEGTALLLLFALGLGLPFFVSALLLDQLKGVFQAIRKHAVIIQRVAGGLLIVIGITMVLGLYGQLIHQIM
ncbi:MAG: cytochrome c biogenesis protein CcdA [Oscillospiraceae bacterium]|nr:cytochrome c biogenesis protein CcdA [Oscillospiraceae bacterium]